MFSGAKLWVYWGGGNLEFDTKNAVQCNSLFYCASTLDKVLNGQNRNVGKKLFIFVSIQQFAKISVAEV